MHFLGQKRPLTGCRRTATHLAMAENDWVRVGLPAGMSFAEAECPLWEGGQHARPHGCTAPGYRKSPAGRRGGIPKCHNGVSAIAYKPTDSTPSCTVGCTACFGTGALASDLIGCVRA